MNYVKYGEIRKKLYSGEEVTWSAQEVETLVDCVEGLFTELNDSTKALRELFDTQNRTVEILKAVESELLGATSDWEGPGGRKELYERIQTELRRVL